MKIALISFTTCSKHLNYGAVLHGYALQRYLARMGAESVVIDYVPRQLEGYSLKWPVLNARFLWRQPLLMVRLVFLVSKDYLPSASSQASYCSSYIS